MDATRSIERDWLVLSQFLALGYHRRYSMKRDATGFFQTASTLVMNPYSSPTTAQSTSKMQAPPWLRRTVILNAMLVVLPLACLVVVYAFIRLSAARESATPTGDPVVYQHFFWINVDPWFAAAYFLVPNGILATVYACWKFGSPTESSSNDAVA